MRLNIVKSANAEQLYIIKSFRKEDGKSTTRIFKKLGTMASLLPLHDNDRDKVISWAKEQARIYTEAEKNEMDPRCGRSPSFKRQICGYCRPGEISGCPI